MNNSRARRRRSTYRTIRHELESSAKRRASGGTLTRDERCVKTAPIEPLKPLLNLLDERLRHNNASSSSTTIRAARGWRRNREQEGIVGAHARRRFFEAPKALPGEPLKSSIAAQEAMRYLDALYAIERDTKIAADENRLEIERLCTC
jgi:hypothetical protein